MTNIPVKIHKLNLNARLPVRSSEQAAGYDVYACCDSEIILNRGSIHAIGTGIAVEIPNGYHISIRARSGLALKHGLTPINTPGTIDSDYRGEIFVPLINLGPADFTIRNGERIAQLLIEKTYLIEWLEVNELNDTKRSGGGFGSTGIH